MKKNKYLQQQLLQEVLVPKTTIDFMLMASKVFPPFTCKLAIRLQFVLVFQKCCVLN